MPTVTWGVVQGRKEKLVSRVIISDYLKTIGIIPHELEELELPSTVEVMRERVEFLQKIGLTVDDMNEYPLMLGCSVRKNIIPVLTYLEKIGLQRSKLGEFIKIYPQCLHTSVVVELVPVIKFLRGLDVEKQDIGYVLMKYPELLGFKLEGTMSTSVAYLVSIGVNPRDVGPMVTQYPYFLGMRVGTTIKPLVDYLVSLGLPKKILARMLEKRAYLLGYDLEETVKPNVNCLLSFGLRKDTLPSVIAQFPQILGLPLKAKLSSQQYFFNLKLKIDPDGFARVIEKMPQIVSLHQHVIMKPVEFLVGRGFSTADVAKMIVKCPQLVALQVGLMKNSYYFFKSDMGRPMEELLDFPDYFTYSLESRIKPRYQRLQNKGIRCSLGWFLNCSDQRFEERLYGDYIEPESSGPSFCMGGNVLCNIRELGINEISESVLVLKGPQGRINRAVWGPLNKTIISACEDAVLHIWDAETGKILKESDKEIGHKKRITSLQKSVDGSHFITGSLDKSAKVVLGGGQDASAATTTDHRAGKFEAKFYDKHGCLRLSEIDKLSINWFQPYELSIKRSVIQRLISDLLQNLSRKISLLCFGLNDSFESESDEEPLLDMGFGHAASFNEFRRSLPPIQEEMEAGDHLAYTATDTDLLHLGGNGSEPCAFSYSSGSLAAGTSLIPDVSVVQDVDEELDSSPTTSVRDTEKQLEVEVVELCKVNQNMSSDEKIDRPKSSIDCLVDGDVTAGELLDITLAQSSIETRDNSGTGPVTSSQENPYDIHGKVNLACKSLLLIGNGSGSEADPEHNVKRRRVTPLDDEEVLVLNI
ncbi:hypothetical protein RDI58_026592 [Solanum bulbocastanum]|uniref:Transcription termination factor MTERF4, chloroplastic n=1 Tax=Solanum bulbocastanum TaxID=147425 RepID=A0AAN8SZC4_SOLBU